MLFHIPAEVIPDFTAHGDPDVQGDEGVVAEHMWFQLQVRAYLFNYAVEAVSRPKLFRRVPYWWIMCTDSALVSCTGQRHGRFVYQPRTSYRLLAKGGHIVY